MNILCWKLYTNTVIALRTFHTVQPNALIYGVYLNSLWMYCLRRNMFGFDLSDQLPKRMVFSAWVKYKTFQLQEISLMRGQEWDFHTCLIPTPLLHRGDFYSHSAVYETNIIISASTTSWSDILPHFNAGREVGQLFSVGRYGLRRITPPVSMAPAQILPQTPPYCLEL